MCGIVGWLNLDGRPVDAHELERVRDTLSHRGPNDAGVHVDGAAGLGFRRLSILDLTPSGHQPMSNEDGSLWVVFNGEIYNYRELRDMVAARGHLFRSSSDTEVLLHLYEDEGPAMLDRLNGMFAFAMWDARKRELFLARDRLGVKPLFYARMPRRLAFASEMRALEALGDFDGTIDEAAPQTFFRCGFIPAPQTIYRGVRKVPPASWLRVRATGDFTGPVRYWNLPLPVEPRDWNEPRWIERVQQLVEDAVRLRLRSDVPVGVFLSGGIDSGVVTALAARASGERLRTYTVSLKGRADDEAPFARLVAERYGTAAYFEEIESDIVTSLPAVAQHFDEPFADASAIPTDAICRAASRHVTVILSGDGGDEMFAGYREYLNGWRARVVDWIPPAMRRAVFGTLATLLPEHHRRRSHCVRLSLSTNERNFWIHHYPYDQWQMHLLQPEWRRQWADLPQPLLAPSPEVQNCGALDQMQYADINFYLPEDILVKVDRMSMRHSLEVRSPFLDYRIAEVALQIPQQLRLRHGRLKHILKQLGARLLPREVIAHPKQGFSIPLAEWMRGPARGWVEQVLLDDSTKRRGFLQPEAVKRLLAVHFNGHSDVSNLIWAMLVFELWFQAPRLSSVRSAAA